MMLECRGHRLAGDQRRQGVHQARQRARSTAAATSRASGSPAPISKKSRHALRRRAQSRSPGPHAQEGANVLLLDEPTNDLDVNAIRALEEALENFAGCAVVISHDRWFLDRLATHILAFEGDSQVVFFDGQLHGLRSGSQEATGHRRGSAASD